VSRSPGAPAGWLVIGTGRHADRFGLPGLARARNATAVALCGSDPDRTAALAARHGVPRWGHSIEALLDDPAVTHVYVCSGNERHEQQTAAAAAAGRPVLCEKLLAPDAATARRMVDACRDHSVALGTAYHLRHNAAHQRAWQLVADGAVGDPLRVSVDYLHATGPADTTARLGASRQVGTPSRGAMAGTGTHAIDLARWFLRDDLVSVSATMSEAGADKDAGQETGPAAGPARIVQVTGTSARGALVTLTAGRAPFPGNGVTLIGTRGHVRITGSIGYHGGGVVQIVSGQLERAAEVAPHDVYSAQFEAFAAAVAAGEPPSASGADGLAALQVAAAVEQSLARGDGPGAPVAVDDIRVSEGAS
jgi:1,5-anhydro-D-fructose reductase (1,5-anhydro-D-mannitol-forming)